VYVTVGAREHDAAVEEISGEAMAHLRVRSRAAVAHEHGPVRDEEDPRRVDVEDRPTGVRDTDEAPSGVDVGVDEPIARDAEAVGSDDAKRERLPLVRSEGERLLNAGPTDRELSRGDVIRARPRAADIDANGLAPVGVGVAAGDIEREARSRDGAIQRRVDGETRRQIVDEGDGRRARVAELIGRRDAKRLRAGGNRGE
jgi:hypothetical protein